MYQYNVKVLDIYSNKPNPSLPLETRHRKTTPQITCTYKNISLELSKGHLIRKDTFLVFWHTCILKEETLPALYVISDFGSSKNLEVQHY